MRHAIAEQFWQRALRGFSCPTSLMLDRPIDSGQQPVGRVQLPFPDNTVAKWKELALELNVSPAEILCAAWAILLARHSGSHDVLFGLRNPSNPIDSSSSATLPFPVHVPEVGSTADWLQQIHNRNEEIEAHCAPVEMIQRWSELPRETPLLESCVVFEGSGAFAAENTGKDLQVVEYPLMVHVCLDSSRNLHAIYDRRRFAEHDIQRLLDRLFALLDGMLTNPQSQVADLPLMSLVERQQILVEWNDTARVFDNAKFLHEQLAEQAEKTPDAVALIFEGTTLSYRQLNERANQVAHHLNKLGVGPESLVGICVERSFEMLIGLYGILKAGGAYVPLDPTYPPDRLHFMLEDAKPAVLLVQERFRTLVQYSPAPKICLDTEWAKFAVESIENPRNDTLGDNLAYVIFTSGSTGKPKGAMNTHAAIRNCMNWMQAEYRLNETDCVVLKTPFSFDVSLWELFWPLLNGAKLIVLKPEGHRDSAYLAETVARFGATTMCFVPSMLAGYLAHRDLPPCPKLRRVICIGEALPVDLQQQFFARFNAELHNLYGPTEAAVAVSYFACRRGERGHTVPIGRPMANTQLYILDSRLRPVPIGVPGELFIGGAHLARGYLNRPELTAEKFIKHPLSDDPAARLYRTGDLARFRSDGNIEFLGRLDFQVKIRGHRIELGEIEASIAEHPNVAHNVVVTREDAPGEKRLIAYLVASDKKNVAVEELREYLQKKLPEYMIPVAFVWLDSLPLNPSGKIDRKSLPAPEQSRPTLRQNFVPPRTEAEHKLTLLWGKVLKLQQIGVHDNFFDLGGDSLRAAQLAGEIEHAFGKVLPLATFLAAPTIEQLAEVLTVRTSERTSSAVIVLQPHGTRPPLFCIPGNGGHVLSFRGVALHLDPDQPVYGLQPQGLDGKSAPQTRMEDIAKYFIEQIRTVQSEGPYYLVGYSLGGMIAYEIAQQLRKANRDVGMVVMLNTSAPGFPLIAPWHVRLSLHARQCMRLGPRDGIAYLKQKIAKLVRRARGIPEATVTNQLERKTDAISRLIAEFETVSFEACRQYRPRKFPGRIDLVRTDQMPAVLGASYDDPNNGWAQFVTAGIAVHTIPGKHLEMFDSPGLGPMIEVLRKSLLRAQSGDWSWHREVHTPLSVLVNGKPIEPARVR